MREYKNHWHPKPNVTELIEDKTAWERNKDEKATASQVFPDMRHVQRNMLVHSGYRTRESVAQASDMELLNAVHAIYDHQTLGARGLVHIRRAIPYQGDVSIPCPYCHGTGHIPAVLEEAV